MAGSCWTKNGLRKKQFATRREAKAARRRYIDEFGDDPGAPYRCTCGWFHLGHYPVSPSIRAALRARHRDRGCV